MATKTISLELDAYDRLRQAKRSERESFSSVVRRAHWNDAVPVAGEILKSLRAAVDARPKLLLPDAALARLARRHRTVRAHTRWQER
jgi:predicted nucleic acid-binding protein